jgi:hypothetical protein
MVFRKGKVGLINKIALPLTPTYELVWCCRIWGDDENSHRHAIAYCVATTR